jgi:hypothetical protein
LPPDGIEARPRHGNTDPHLENFLRSTGTGKYPGNGAGSYSFKHCPSQHSARSSKRFELAFHRKAFLAADCQKPKIRLPRDGAKRTMPQLMLLHCRI